MNPDEMKAARRKKKADRTEAERQELLKGMSIRQRLEHNLETSEITIEIEDNDLSKIDEKGTVIQQEYIKLRFHKLNPIEHDRLEQLGREMAMNTKDLAKVKELAHEMHLILESKSLDGLDAKFWEAGTGYSADVRTKVITKIMAASVLPDAKFMEEINKFR